MKELVMDTIIALKGQKVSSVWQNLKVICCFQLRPGPVQVAVRVGEKLGKSLQVGFIF